MKLLTMVFRSTVVTLILTLVVGGFYPLAVFIVGKVIFPEKTQGGIISRNHRPVGAELIGQNFTSPKYFHGRPSAAGKDGYDAAASSGSNLGPTNQKLIDAVSANVQRIIHENVNLKSGQVPVELVTASASGLDPHISPVGAQVQVARVAAARGVTTDRVQSIVNRFTQGRSLGFLGAPVVNVLKLNLALDESFSAP